MRAKPADDEVVLVGGATEMPMVALVRSLIGKEPSKMSAPMNGGSGCR